MDITALALKYRLPAMYPRCIYAEARGLISDAASRPDIHYRAVAYVDKILKRAKPADLPVDQPAKFEHVINPKTVQALGRTIPPSLLFQADEVIQ